MTLLAHELAVHGAALYVQLAALRCPTAAAANRRQEPICSSLVEHLRQTYGLQAVPGINGSAKKTSAEGRQWAGEDEAHCGADCGGRRHEAIGSLPESRVALALLIYKREQLRDEDRAVIACCPADAARIKGSEEISSVPLGFHPP